MNKPLPIIAAVIFMLSAIVGILLTAVDVFATDTSFYKKEYRKLNTAADIGITQEELDEATNVLIEYTVGKRDNLDVTAVFVGESRQVFDERERAHMVDVRSLYLGAMVIKRAALILAGVMLFLILINAKRGHRVLFIKSSLITWLAGMAVFGALGAWAAINFNSFWTAFHHLFFTNTLYLLDPSTEVLIMMVPEQFFFDLCTAIIITFAAVCALLAVLLVIWQAFTRRAAHK